MRQQQRRIRLRDHVARDAAENPFAEARMAIGACHHHRGAAVRDIREQHFGGFDPSGNFLFIGNQAAHAIEAYTYNLDSGALTLITGSPFSTGPPPGKMALSE